MHRRYAIRRINFTRFDQSERDRLRRCYSGGLKCYEALYGRRRMRVYRLVELIGSTARYAAYRVAAAAVGGSYYRERATFYSWLCSFYLRPATHHGPTEHGVRFPSTG